MDILCCAGCASCALCCCCGGWSVPPKTKFAAAKWLYATLFGISLIATWVLRDWAATEFAQHIGDVSAYCKSASDVTSCAAGQIAMRISFANFCFFSLHFVVLLGMKSESDVRVDVHAGAWALKLLLWVGALIGFFWMPTTAVYGYAKAARILSSLFLVVQLVLIIHLFYEVNEWLVSKDTRASWAMLVSGAIVGFGLGLAAIGIAYHLYALSPSCRLNIFFCTFSLLVGLALVAILFVPGRTATAGLLTSGAVFLYCSYLLLSSLSSQPPDQDCVRGGGVSPRWIQIVGFFIALGTVLYSTVTAGVASKDMFGNKHDDSTEGLLPYRADFFHLVFALASMYIAMLFSNWQVSPRMSSFEIDKGWTSSWVKMASKWACEVLYAWTVVAPALLPGRDFGP